MIALLQRVSEASVSIDETVVGQIGIGLCVLIGVQPNDDEQSAQKLVDKLLGYRVFPDEQGRMNLDIKQANAQLLLVPQFTLAADTSQGRRPGFSTAAKPELAEALFSVFCTKASKQLENVQTGRFGADMKVALINDGPVTIWIDSKRKE